MRLAFTHYHSRMTQRSVAKTCEMPAVNRSDVVLTEAVAILEQLDPTCANQPHADAIGRAATGHPEQRFIARAKATSNATQLEHSHRGARRTIGLAVMVGAVAAGLAGIGAGRAALTSPRDEPVNFFWAIGTALGVQTFFLALWLVVAVIGSTRKAGHPHALGTLSVGSIVVNAAQAIAARIHRNIIHAAAFTAYTRTILTGPLGLWTVSAISHGLWMMFNIGLLGTLIVLLSGRQFSFAWETTILSEREFVPLTELIATFPLRVGFPAPSREQILASQWPWIVPPDHAIMQAWSGLLIGSIVMYGFGPRVLLLGFTLGRRRIASNRLHLDLSRPEFAAWHHRLMPTSETLGIIDPDDGPPSNGAAAGKSGMLEVRPVGPPAIIGFELPSVSGRSGWPPALHGVRWNDLGMVDSRDDQHRIANVLRDSPDRPQAVVVVCSLTSTPDRGVGTFLTELMQACGGHITIVLTEGDALRHRVDATAMTRRIDDWHILGRGIGISNDDIHEIDLNHLTQTTAAKLAAIVQKSVAQPPGHRQRNIDAAFNIISLHAETWTHKPDAPVPAEEIELHRAIARLYDHGGSRWRELFSIPKNLDANIGSHLKTNSERLLTMLPPRLRSSPKWIAAGAAAGALGCLAAATLVAPVAISALPMWTVVGGAVATAITMIRQQGVRTDSPEHVQRDFTSAVQTVTLFALLLELQGREEIAITRILDRTLGDAQIREDVVLSSASIVRQWLDDVRHQLDIALAQEPGR